MKNNKMIIGILCTIAVIIIGGLIWWNAPCSITDIAPSKVSKIEIFNGTTGRSITITDSADIEHIINNLNTISLKKEKISLGYMGCRYITTVYKANGNVYKKFIISSSDTIRKDPFFYQDSSASIDSEYIHKLFDKYAK